MTEDQIAEEGMALIRMGKAEEGASILVRRLSNRLRRHFEWNRVPADQAEELVNDTWLKLLTSPLPREVRAIVWIWTIARSVLLDWVSRQQTQSRAGSKERPSGELLLDEDGWAAVADTVAAPQAPAWLTLCLERAAHLFERDEPRRAEVLRFSSERWSAEEIAIYFGASPPVSDKQKTAARNRVLDAAKRARGYFEHCKEEA